MYDVPFVMERAEWLGYVTGQDHVPGYATHGEPYEAVLAGIHAWADHQEQPDGTWLALLHPPLEGWPPQVRPTEEPVLSLHNSLTIAGLLADSVMPPGSVVLHTIDRDPYLLVDLYRQQHPGEYPLVSRMWTGVTGVPQPQAV